MLLRGLMAATVLAFVGSAALAEDNDPNATRGGSSLDKSLGFDVGKAGETDETRTAYWQSFNADQQTQITTWCKDETDTKPRTNAEVKFCQVVVK
jgi:hypothetical protein